MGETAQPDQEQLLQHVSGVLLVLICCESGVTGGAAHKDSGSKPTRWDKPVSGGLATGVLTVFGSDLWQPELGMACGTS